MPTYTIPEAAGILAVARRTLFSWYEGEAPILRASGEFAGIQLLSYRDIEEAFRLYLIRERYGIPMQKVRLSLCNARRLFRSAHPLQRADAVKGFFDDIVYDKPAKGHSPRTVTSLAQRPGQQIVDEVMDLFGERIVEGEFLFPWRFVKSDESRPVSVNPNIMSGRLVVIDTRIPVEALAGSSRAGMPLPAIAKEYGLSSDLVEKALRHVGLYQEAA